MNTPKKVTYVDLVSTLQTINIFRGLTFIEDDFKYIDELMGLLSQQTVNQKNTNGTLGNLDESLLLVVEKRNQQPRGKSKRYAIN